MNENDSKKPDPKVFSVSELNLQARVTIEKQFNLVWVEGELSNFARPRSGHWYFTLKDDNAQVRCAMFANRNRLAQLQPADGQQVLIKGRVSIYEGRGDFQIIVDQIEHAGEGLLRQAYEQLKVKLSSEGLFSEESKKPLPSYPRHIAIVSSPTGAAVKDILAVWGRRYPALEVTLVPTSVQGENAATEIIEALDSAEKLGPDLIIVTRGGGSLEDLWSFNLESVARRIFACQIPLVSAIGHEIDFTIADFVSDIRAPTPSAAAEIAVPELTEIRDQVKDFEKTLINSWKNTKQMLQLTLQNARLRLLSPTTVIEQAHQRIDDASNRTLTAITRLIDLQKERLANNRAQLRILGPNQKLSGAKSELLSKKTRLIRSIQDKLLKDDERLRSLARVLESVSPLPTLSRGYAIVRDQDSASVLTKKSQLEMGQRVVTRITDAIFVSKIEKIENTEEEGSGVK